MLHWLVRIAQEDGAIYDLYLRVYGIIGRKAMDRMKLRQSSGR